jgi:acetyltransferase-like isoleucine patch superfamily enzyme
MTTLTLKVGETMINAESANTEGNKNMTDRERPVSESINHRTLTQRFYCLLLKLQLKEMGSSIRCAGKIKLMGTKNVKIGSGTKFGKNIVLKTEGRGYLHIGENVIIGDNVRIISASNVIIEDHANIGDDVIISDILTEDTADILRNKAKAVYIGKDVWIGKGSKIYAGITIGNGATLSPNSVVLQSIPPQVIAAGAPAKIIKER